MAIKFDKRIRLWKTGDSTKKLGIGIKFGKGSSKEERGSVLKAVEAVITLKYGKGER